MTHARTALLVIAVLTSALGLSLGSSCTAGRAADRVADRMTRPEIEGEYDPIKAQARARTPAQRDLHRVGTLAIFVGVLVTALPFILPGSLWSWSGGPVMVLSGVAAHTLAPHATLVGWLAIAGMVAGIAMTAYGTLDNKSLAQRGKHLLGLSKSKEPADDRAND